MATNEDLMVELLERWEDAVQAGLPVTPEELCQDTPELLDDFRALLTKLGSVNAFFSGSASLAETDDFIGPADGGRYRIHCFHDRGGQSVIFAAEDLELKRTVALKWMPALSAIDPTQRHRFIREAEIMARLDHPGIVPIYGLGHDENGQPYYAMRMVQGVNLGELARAFYEKQEASQERYNLEFRRLLKHFVSVCTTIAYAHARGVIHRDLKPANIRIGPFDETVVLDWGLAKQTNSQETEQAVANEFPLQTDSCSTASSGQDSKSFHGSVLGTPAYMSPEQATGDLSEIRPATDIYGLGATLYLLLCGQAPCRGNSLGEVLAKVKQGDFPPPRAIRSDVPRALEAVCLKAMSHKPVDRYSDARALADDIEHWLADEPVTVYQDPWYVQTRRWLSRHRTLAVAMTAVAAAVFFASGVFNLVLDRKNRQLDLAKTRAEANYTQSRNALQNMVEVIVRDSALANNAALFPVREAVLERAMENARALLARNPDDMNVRIESAALAACLADTQRMVGKYAEARQILAEALLLCDEPNEEGSAEMRHARALVRFMLAETFATGDPAGVRIYEQVIDELLPLVDQYAADSIFTPFGVRYAPAVLLAKAVILLPHRIGDDKDRWKWLDDHLAILVTSKDDDERYLIETVRYQMWRQAMIDAAANESNLVAAQERSGRAILAARCMSEIKPNDFLAAWVLQDIRAVQAGFLIQAGQLNEAHPILVDVCDQQERLVNRTDAEWSTLTQAWQSVGQQPERMPLPTDGAGSFLYRLMLTENLMALAAVEQEIGIDNASAMQRAEQQLNILGLPAEMPDEIALKIIRFRLDLADVYAFDSSLHPRVASLSAPVIAWLEPHRSNATSSPTVHYLLCNAHRLLFLVETNPVDALNHLQEAESLRERIDQPEAPTEFKHLAMQIAAFSTASLSGEDPPPMDKIQSAAADVFRLAAALKQEIELTQILPFQRGATHSLVRATLMTAERQRAQSPIPQHELAKLFAPAIAALIGLRGSGGSLDVQENAWLAELERLARGEQ
ncbi:MAG TPA: serine/threonine-protein kinase [Pirellulaceae bacterium]|nr:serine/threonine-protein kinase [Pirellulaceae bacterium]HMP69751.1 serine/threonine-protein kinase [Pirellulaceae bacterium]